MNEEAQAYKERVILEAQGEVARFAELLPQYEAAPTVTRERIYLETMEEVLSKTSKVLVDTKGGNNMMYLPLDKMMEQRSSSTSSPARSSTTPYQSLPMSSSDNSGRPSTVNSGIRDSRFGSGGERI